MWLRNENIKTKYFIGKKQILSFSENKTFALWQSFMPHRNSIVNRVGIEYYSIEIYPNPNFFFSFDPTATFEKWAAVEVNTHEITHENMEAITIPSGLYTVFLHTGLSNCAEKTYRSIFEMWLPVSAYQLDDRPHFAVMGEKYKKNDVSSEEEIWIPIKAKTH